MRTSHAGRQLRFDEIRPPAGELRQYDLLLDSEPLIIVFHPRHGIPKAPEHCTGTGTRQRTDSGYVGRIAGKVDADIKPFVTELQCRFGRRETASDTFKGIPGHEMGIAIDDHREPPRADRLYELAALTASLGCKQHRFCP
jgi:hypothetical protein